VLSAASAGLVAGGCAQVHPLAQEATVGSPADTTQQPHPVPGPDVQVGLTIGPPQAMGIQVTHPPDAGMQHQAGGCTFFGECVLPPTDAGMLPALRGSVAFPPGLVARPSDDAGEADGGS
jgi:hypothetical protein